MVETVIAPTDAVFGVDLELIELLPPPARVVEPELSPRIFTSKPQIIVCTPEGAPPGEDYVIATRQLGENRPITYAWINRREGGVIVELNQYVVNPSLSDQEQSIALQYFTEAIQKLLNSKTFAQGMSDIEALLDQKLCLSCFPAK